MTDHIQVLGIIWMPAVPAATSYNVSPYDVENMTDDSGDITRESVSLWLDSHAGDFQSVTDFSAVIGTGIIPWADEDNEITYIGLMYPEECE